MISFFGYVCIHQFGSIVVQAKTEDPVFQGSIFKGSMPLTIVLVTFQGCTPDQHDANKGKKGPK